MSDQITPIETNYNGFVFRSRLEARRQAIREQTIWWLAPEVDAA